MTEMVLPVAEIKVRHNGRTKEDDEAIQGLAQSIKELGLQVPLIVRQLGEIGGPITYELVAGHRRLAAAKLLGLETVAVRLWILSDEQAEEVQLVENTQRVDINPMDEAKAYDRLIDSMKIAPADVAARVGKPVGYVLGRLKLCALSAGTQKAVRSGAIEVSVGVLLARIPDPQVRIKAERMIESWTLEDGPIRLEDVRQAIETEFMLELRNAPWKLADASMRGGPCTTCPNRTGNQPELFPEIADRDTCTSPRCFALKKAQAWERAKEDAKAQGRRVLADDEAKALFPYGDDRATASGKYVNLDATTEEYGNPRTWRGLIGEHLEHPPAIARTPNGNIVEVVPKDEIRAAAKRAGLKPKERALGSAAEAADAAKKEAAEIRDRMNRVRRQVAAIVGAYEAVSIASLDDGREILLRVMVADLVRNGGTDLLRNIAKRVDLKVGEHETLFDVWKQVERRFDSLKKPEAAQARASLLLEAAISRGAYLSWLVELPDAFKLAAKLLKVDLDEAGKAKPAKGKKGACRTCGWTGDPKAKPERQWANKEHTLCTECDPSLRVPKARAPEGPPRSKRKATNLRPRKKAAAKKRGRR